MTFGITLQYQNLLQGQIDEVYPELYAMTDQYLAAVEDLRLKKLVLDRSVDGAYREGVVEGKNEREREAFLRTRMPQPYAEVEEATQVLSRCERAYRKADIAVRQLEETIKLLCLNIEVGPLDFPASTPQTP